MAEVGGGGESIGSREHVPSSGSASCWCRGDHLLQPYIRRVRRPSHGDLDYMGSSTSGAGRQAACSHECRVQA
jgi:hypothetical protein